VTETALEPVTTRAARLLAPNPGPMTLDGTNSWVLREPGSEQVVVVDPGPDDAEHLSQLAAAGEIALILLTHGHDDHREGADSLRALTGAPVRAADPALCRGAGPFDPNGESLTAAGVRLEVLPTPGHTADSVSVLLAADAALLTGDTVLGRGTTVVAHPDGRLGAYLDSLRRLRTVVGQRGCTTLLPGHGPVVTDPRGVLDGYLEHREQRLDQVRAALAAGVEEPTAVVVRVYGEMDDTLAWAAELSARAQLDYLRGVDVSAVER
jgi:glyoxylase-like metal-dependent hydrolase (beta-lactamase superfamily II)